MEALINLKIKYLFLITSLIIIGGGISYYNITNSKPNNSSTSEVEGSEPNWKEIKTVDILELRANGESLVGLNEARDSNDWWDERIANEITNLHISFNNMFWTWEQTIDFENEEDIEYLNKIKENIASLSEMTNEHKMNQDIQNAYLILEKTLEVKDPNGLQIAHNIIHDLDIFYNGYKVNEEKSAAESFDDKPFFITYYNGDSTEEVDEFLN